MDVGKKTDTQLLKPCRCPKGTLGPKVGGDIKVAGKRKRRARLESIRKEKNLGSGIETNHRGGVTVLRQSAWINTVIDSNLGEGGGDHVRLRRGGLKGRRVVSQRKKEKGQPFTGGQLTIAVGEVVEKVGKGTRGLIYLTARRVTFSGEGKKGRVPL